jgi:hypothetical protein
VISLFILHTDLLMMNGSSDAKSLTRSDTTPTTATAGSTEFAAELLYISKYLCKGSSDASSLTPSDTTPTTATAGSTGFAAEDGVEGDCDRSAVFPTGNELLYIKKYLYKGI